MWSRSGLLVAAVAVVGCNDIDLPARPAGGGVGIDLPGEPVPPIDAPVDAFTLGDASLVQLNGLVCVIRDLRLPEQCPPVTSDNAGIIVRESGIVEAATTDLEGRFTLPVTSPTVVLDIGDNVVALQRSRARVAVAPTVIEVPVVTAADFAAVLDSLAVPFADDTGAIVVRVDDRGAPARGVVFDMVPGSAFPTFFDGATALAWRDQGGTGAAGAALMVDVPPGTFTLTGVAPDGRVIEISNVSVEANRITFVRGSLP